MSWLAYLVGMLTKRELSYVQHSSIYAVPGDDPIVRIALTNSAVGTYQFPCITVVHDYSPEEARQLASELYEAAERAGRDSHRCGGPCPVDCPSMTWPETPCALHPTIFSSVEDKK